MSPSLARKLKSSVWMIVGTSIVFSTIVLMNNYSDKPQKKEANKSMSMEVIKQPPKKPEQKPKPKPKPKPKKAQPAKASVKPANLGSGVGGLSFGLPSFDMGFDDLDNALLGDTKDVVMTSDTVDVVPKATSRPPLEYPAKLRAKGVTGYVTFNILINVKGEVEDIQILESEPAGVFDDVATEAIREWQFSPAQYKNENVKVWAKQTITFKLGG